MEPTRELADAIYRDRVLRARKRSPDEKFRAGAELFHEACQRMAAGLRMENPGVDEETIQALLVRRLDYLRRLRQHDVRK
ncbi:MAG TPA: hypothetical protein VG406_01510 [Isosphaeraceae bacterium]|nr:hypothetical protein [Isosphaeraceae bacterium]